MHCSGSPLFGAVAKSWCDSQTETVYVGNIQMKLPQTTLLRGATALAVAALLTLSTNAQAEQPITRIEEDWCIIVGAPSPEDQTPQLTCVMSSGHDLNAPHAVLEINHSTLPYYIAGGLQIQSWQGEHSLGYARFRETGRLHKVNEHIDFKMTMEVSNGVLKFEVLDGTSETWSVFGGQGYLKQVLSTSVNDLSQYSPSVSLRHSHIGFASHRVQSFVLKEVRYYSGTDLVRTESEDRVLHSHAQ